MGVVASHCPPSQAARPAAQHGLRTACMAIDASIERQSGRPASELGGPRSAELGAQSPFAQRKALSPANGQAQPLHAYTGHAHHTNRVVIANRLVNAGGSAHQDAHTHPLSIQQMLRFHLNLNYTHHPKRAACPEHLAALNSQATAADSHTHAYVGTVPLAARSMHAAQTLSRRVRHMQPAHARLQLLQAARGRALGWRRSRRRIYPGLHITCILRSV